MISRITGMVEYRGERRLHEMKTLGNPTVKGWEEKDKELSEMRRSINTVGKIGFWGKAKEKRVRIGLAMMRREGSIWKGKCKLMKVLFLFLNKGET
jgi:hypothetical protein